VCFDGTDIWVSLNIGLARLRPADGKVVGSFIQLGGPTGLAFDGANIWVALGVANLVAKF
jgi:hypothetical protein